MSAPTSNLPTTAAADSSPASSAPAAETSSAAEPTSAETSAVPASSSTPEATSAAPESSAAPETTSSVAQQTTTIAPETSSPVTSSPAATSSPEQTQSPSLVSSISTTPIGSSVDPASTTAADQITTASVSTSTFVTTITSTDSSGETATSVDSSSTASASSTDTSSGGGGGGGMSDGARIAIAVVVPVVAIAGLAAGGLWWWKRRKAMQVAEEERRKEAEDYSYNPNGDPTIPGTVAAADGAYEMRQDSNTGYRGWGTTTIGSSGRKASTTLSGPVAVAYSDDTSPSHGAPDARSGDRLIESQADSYSPEGEILGAMGSGQGQVSDVHRGLSNASSSYSAAGRSDGSGDGNIGVAYSGVVNNQFYDQYGSANPYDAQYQEGYTPNGQVPGAAGLQPSELPGQPVIRDNPARRNTRIEGPSHFPQQSAGIAQNF